MAAKRSPIDADAEIDLDPTIWEEFVEWAEASRLMLVLTGSAFTWAAHFFLSRTTRSTYFCSDFDRKGTTVLLQYAGLILDALMLVSLWRLLVFARTTKLRLRTLAGVLLGAAMLTGLESTLEAIWRRHLVAGLLVAQGLTSADALSLLDVIVVTSALILSSALVISDEAPSNLTSTLTFLCAAVAAGGSIAKLGTYEVPSNTATVLPLWLLLPGFSFYMYGAAIHHIAFIRRGFIALLLFATLIGVTFFALLTPNTVKGHLVEKLIYEARIDSGRWMVQATVSDSLKVAVQEYKERNLGRSPPPNFDKWYEFALSRNSVIIDMYDQIRDDLLPFWSFDPDDLRWRTDRLLRDSERREQSNYAFIDIENGTALYHMGPGHGDEDIEVIDALTSMIKDFAQYLPNMYFAVNVGTRAEVLPESAEIDYRLGKAGQVKSGKLARRAALLVGEGVNGTVPGEFTSRATIQEQAKAIAEYTAFREALATTCPTGSACKDAGWCGTRNFCASCANPQSTGQFIMNAAEALELCHQPDMMHLHSLHLDAGKSMTWSGYMPVFSRSKTSSFKDILIPLPYPSKTQAQDTGAMYVGKQDRLYWRGKISTAYPDRDHMHGGQHERLSHMINNASSSEVVTVLLPTYGNNDRFAYEQTRLRDLNGVLPLDIGISDFRACESGSCDQAIREFGMKAPAPTLENRYVLLVDESHGPSPNVLPAVRSTSIPFVATIFREWYTERLLPWLHYVPVDLRYHGLHSTLAYFSGLSGKVNGREILMHGKMQDAEWIAEQGKRWADKAMRREDMQIYLFRLLLEWGRLIDDRRAELGFVLDQT
jgi:hypothetical protein